MISPRVSFIVPCYNLAHLLKECIDSILSQTYTDLEILVMDDCSPDNTPEVARSYQDPRVIHVRNEHNLRHLANYNKGITLARGEFVWLISADDRLRRPYVLERYVNYLDAHPQSGYVFCPAMAVKDGRETEIERWSFLGAEDTTFTRHAFLKRLMQGNCVTAPAGMVRRKCYDLSLFPLDMPYAGDWFLWSLFALHHDVGYLGEAMINYRIHDQSFTSFYLTEGIKAHIADEINVRWQIMDRARAAGYDAVVQWCREAIADDYATRIFGRMERGSRHGITVHEFEESLASHAGDATVARHIRSRVWLKLADRYYESSNFDAAAAYYREGLKEDPALIRGWLKYALLQLGSAGVATVNTASRFRRILRKGRQATVAAGVQGQGARDAKP